MNPTTSGDRTAPPGSSRTGTAASDARPALITSRRTDAAMGAVAPMAIRDVLQTRPRSRRRRLRLSSGALVGVALAGSIGAVTAVNATLFPSLGRPTTESVWQNPGKVPSTEAESTEPTTPRAVRVLVVDPTAPPVVSAESARALTTTLPESSEAPTSSVEVLAEPQPTPARPTNSGSSSNGGSGNGTVTGTTIATVPAAAPVTTTGTKSGSGGSGSSTSSPVTTDHSSTSAPATTPTTDPSTTDATVPSNTGSTAPSTSVDDNGGSNNSGKGKGGGG